MSLTLSTVECLPLLTANLNPRFKELGINMHLNLSASNSSGHEVVVTISSFSCSIHVFGPASLVPQSADGKVLTLLASFPAISSAFLFSSFSLFPNKTGGLASAGVGNVNGLGKTALFSPVLPQLSQSLNSPPGEAMSDCSIYLDGRAEIGVSILLLLLLLFSYALLFCCDVGGGGRANGFPGPEAPAERSAEADGDGGGNTMPL